MNFSSHSWWTKFQSLLSYGVDATQLEPLSKELEREKRRILLHLDKAQAKQQRFIERIKLARQQNRDSEIDLLYQELQVLKEERQSLVNKLRVLGLESLTLKRFLKSLAHLDQQKQKKWIPKILKKLQNKTFSEKLLNHQVDTSSYFEELDLAFNESDLDPTALNASQMDREKAVFLREIDTLLQAEKGEV
jgi:regulator of replication initiation timing